MYAYMYVSVPAGLAPRISAGSRPNQLQDTAAAAAAAAATATAILFAHTHFSLIRYVLVYLYVFLLTNILFYIRCIFSFFCINILIITMYCDYYYYYYL